MREDARVRRGAWVLSSEVMARHRIQVGGSLSTVVTPVWTTGADGAVRVGHGADDTRGWERSRVKKEVGKGAEVSVGEEGGGGYGIV